MAEPKTIEEAVALIKRDPVRGFVAIPIIAMRDESKKPIEALIGKSRRVLLPAWTGKEWRWYATVAESVMAACIKSGKVRPVQMKDIRRQNAKLAELLQPMERLGDQVALAIMAGVFYEACVRLVIASVSTMGKTGGELMAEVLKEQLGLAPESVKRGLSKLLDLGGDALAAVGRQANKVVKSVFGVGLGAVALVLLVAWGYSKSRRGR